jgi:hypothetical protein
MESQNNRAVTEEAAGMLELELAQLAEITGGICQRPIIEDGHIVFSPPIPETHPRIL